MKKVIRRTAQRSLIGVGRILSMDWDEKASLLSSHHSTAGVTGISMVLANGDSDWPGLS